MRLISWNVNKAAAERIGRQGAALGERGPDVVALQEVRASTAEVWRVALARLGLEHALLSVEGVPEALTDRRRAVGGVLVASRWRLEPLPRLEIPWPERLLSAVVARPSGAVELHAAYLPNMATGPEVGKRWLKVEVFEGIARTLGRPAERPRVLCGDFNAPFAEQADGTIVPFGARGRAAEAELSVLYGLARHDLGDVFRRLNGYAARDKSWYSTQGNGYRLDHIFASASLGARGCRYVHELRAVGMSDHAPIEADFD